MLARQVARIDDKGAVESRDEPIERGPEGARDSAWDFVAELSSVRCVGAAALVPTQPGGCGVTDETQRTRLIADIMRLIGEPSMPEHTRHAGLTLVGWLARRRPGEAPHTIGIDEARESERRIAARPKTR